MTQLLNDYLKLLGRVGEEVVGIGVTAFNRVGPVWFYPNYRIVCYKNSSDLEEVEKKVKTVCVQRDLAGEGDIERLNSLAILEHKGVEKYLRELGLPWLFLYRTTERIDKLAEERGYRLLTNRSQVRDRYEDKREFFKIGREIGLPMIQGEQLEVDGLTKERYGELREKWGEKLVFQLCDYTRGGGAGTVFVFSRDDYLGFLVDLEKRRKERVLAHVNVTQYVEGVSGSITGCVTKHGVLCGVVQTQVVDVEGLPRDKAKNGVFQGHDWSFGEFGEEIQKKAERMVIRLGENMQEHGYKGVFGIDLMIDVGKQEVYPVECNPRYTGAFPVYTMLQMSGGEVPMDVFQLLEFLEVEYDLDVEGMNREWKRQKVGAHLILNNPFSHEWVKVIEGPQAGRYRLDAGRLVRLGGEIFWGSIQNEDEFILTDGVPLAGQMVKPGLRLGKLMFGRGVLETEKRLNQWTREVVRAVYDGYKVEPMEVR